MTNSFLSAPRNLQHARSQLLNMTVDGKRETSRLMALAECNFRLAVHPETAARDAIGLLQESVKIDGSNPKYAYHLGRIHFLRGEFTHAARWFRLACCLVPTSHRIWGHVAVLLRELNAVYHGAEEYEANVLRNRSEAITEAIRNGNDSIDPDLLDFVPPKSRAAEEKEARQGRRSKSCVRAETSRKQEMRPSPNVRRYLDAKKCRWSGVDHLFVEQTLEGRPTQSNLRRLVPVLQDVAARAHTRRGFSAAVAILCVQWLVSGYPVETIRRILGSLPDGLPSTELLHTVCRIFEAPLHEVPQLLASGIQSGRLPPLVGAAIHRQRLLWHPLEYRSLGSYRAACRLIAERWSSEQAARNGSSEAERNEIARDLIRRLERAIASLDCDPPKSLKDEVPQEKKQIGASGQSLLEEFDALEKGVGVLIHLKDEGFRLIKEGLDVATANLSTSETYSQAVADHRAAQEFSVTLAEVTEDAMKRSYELSKRLPAQDDVELPDDFAPRSEAMISSLQSASNLGKFAKVLRRIEKRIAAVAEHNAPSPVEPVAEWAALLAALRTALPEETPGEAPLTQSLEDRLLLLEAAAKCVEVVRGAVSEYLRTTLDPAVREVDNAAIYSQAIVDHEFLDTLLTNLHACGERELEHLETLRQEIANTKNAELPENLDGRLENATNSFRAAMNLGSLRKRQARAGKKLAATAEKLLRQATSPSESLQQLQQQLDSLAGDTPGDATTSSEESQILDAQKATGSDPVAAAVSTPPQPQRPLPPKPRNEMTALEHLKYTLMLTDWSVFRMFTAATETFDAYPEWIRLMPPFESMRRRIRGQMAECLYQLGRRQMAQTTWNAMLRTNRLDVDALKNIAICHTANGDVGLSLRSWREYVELLYLFDVLAGTPRANAGVRAQFHRAFGSAYAPSFLSAEFDHEWTDNVDPAALISFLSSPGRFRSYIDHRLLQYLNTRFEYESPSLVLGIKRVEAETHTDDAEKTMMTFIQEVGQMIPGRAKEQFTALAEKTIRDTAKQCRESRQLTLQATPMYEEEEKHQIELLARMFDLKIKLVVAFRDNVDMVKNITSFDFLRELSRLDLIPLNISPGLIPNVAHTMRVDREMLVDLTASLRQNVILALLQYLLADDDEAERPIRQRQYTLLTDNWLRDKEFVGFARLVDTPPPGLMPDEAAKAIQGDEDEPALKWLCAWHDRYPAMAGLAVMIANRLIKRNEFEEARARLERSRKVAFYEPTRRYINTLIVQILIRKIEPLLEDEEFEEALKVCIEMVERDDYQEKLVYHLLDLFMKVSADARRPCHQAEVSQAVEGWIARATCLLSQPEDDDPISRATKEQIEKVRSKLDKTVGQVNRRT